MAQTKRTCLRQLSLLLLATAGGCAHPPADTTGEQPPGSASPQQQTQQVGIGAMTVGTSQMGSSTAATPGQPRDASASSEPDRAPTSDASSTAAAGSPGSPNDASSTDPTDTTATASTETQAPKEPRLRCADVESAQLTDPSTPYPGGSWQVPEPTHGMIIERDIRIEMSDGVELIGDVAYPAQLATGQRASGEFPVLLTQNPYGAGAFGADSGEIFVTHGYIFASIDVRGTGRSQGVHDMFSPREADDGAELVAWAAALAGSDGKVGLQGCSQLGINQLETATRLGPDSPVKAMIPACGSGDFYRDTAFDNGIPTIVGSLAAPSGDGQYYRDYWRERDRVARAPAIAEAAIPSLLWSGWHEPGALGSLELYVALQNLSAGRPATAPITANEEVSGSYQVILGDWGHAMGLDMGIQLQWYDTWIKGEDTGLATQTQTPLHLAELGGTKRWINSRCYPLTESYTALFLGDDGMLTTEAQASAGSEALSWVEAGARSEAVQYASEPYDDGAMLAGPLAAQLHVSSSNANIQLTIEVLDRSPDGTLAKISQASVLGSLRRTDPQKSWTDDEGLPVRPYLTLDEEQPVTPDEPTLLVVPLWPSVWSIEPGHSIVVRFATQPSSDDCLNPLGVPVGCYPSTSMTNSLRGGRYSLHHGGELASFVSLPLVDHGAFATADSAWSPTGAVIDSVEYPLPIEW